MPEGDTIHRAAARLRAALLDRELTAVDLPRRPPPWPAVGATVTAVEARGKHLLIATDDGLTIHTHQRMTGSWHLYRPGERWRKSPRSAVVRLQVAGRVAVCFAAPIVEVLPTDAVPRHPTLGQLGPDLCLADPDLDEVLRRLRARAADRRTIGEALLDQRISAGIGNVYRCDVLFLHGLHPATPVEDLPDAVAGGGVGTPPPVGGAPHGLHPATPVDDVGDPLARSLFATAARLLRANLSTADRTTTGGRPGTLWVHGRGGQPCRRCRTPVVVEHLGEQARVVYRCPLCQPWVTRRGGAAS